MAWLIFAVVAILAFARRRRLGPIRQIKKPELLAPADLDPPTPEHPMTFLEWAFWVAVAAAFPLHCAHRL